MAATIVACLLLLLPAGTPAKYLGFFWLLPLMFYQPDTPVRGDFNVAILDVGQGLSVVVQTQRHILVYDTGPKFGSRFDMGESVVLPYLHTKGIKRINALVISHGDNDHIGGANSLLREIPAAAVLTSVPDKFANGVAQFCLAGSKWRWDDVNFQIIYPYQEAMKSGNDSSCVLLIDNGKHHVLLTGDIEKFAEKQLLQLNPASLKSDLLTAPHHGSKTSSQSDFIRAVSPQYVVFATGYRNRYHFPHQNVVKRYEDAGVLQLNSVDAGAIEFRFGHDNDLLMPVQHRISNHRYWHD
jgi:competence protein ComEC